MHTVVVASDSMAVRRQVCSVVAGPDVEVCEASSGPDVLATVETQAPDLVIVDMQMGSMGAMAVCLELRLQESTSSIPHVPVLMLLDRRPDVFLARRSKAEGWVIKPLDPLRLRRAVATLLAADTYHDDTYQPVPLLQA